MSSSAGPKRARPLSPHLSVYKPQLTSVLSIMHRMTGVALSFGSIIFVAWLAALAGGPESYATFGTYAQTWAGQIVLFGLTGSFFYHLCNGIRHLLWDTGLFLDLPSAYKTGRIVVGVSIILTLVVWLKIYGVSL